MYESALTDQTGILIKTVCRDNKSSLGCDLTPTSTTSPSRPTTSVAFAIDDNERFEEREVDWKENKDDKEDGCGVR